VQAPSHIKEKSIANRSEKFVVECFMMIAKLITFKTRVREGHLTGFVGHQTAGLATWRRTAASAAPCERPAGGLLWQA
jgi:hypothetical protein